MPDARPERNDAIDCLRGSVMVLMALDHTRMFLGSPWASRIAYPLPAVYVPWGAVVLTLYPACQWFAAVKRQHRTVWMSFL